MLSWPSIHSSSAYCIWCRPMTRSMTRLISGQGPAKGMDFHPPCHRSHTAARPSSPDPSPVSSIASSSTQAIFSLSRNSGCLWHLPRSLTCKSSQLSTVPTVRCGRRSVIKSYSRNYCGDGCNAVSCVLIELCFEMDRGVCKPG